MTPQTNITSPVQELSDYLFSKGVHHYLDTISAPLTQREIIELPIRMIAENSMQKLAMALNVCLALIEGGYAVTKSEDNNLLWITPKQK